MTPRDGFPTLGFDPTPGEVHVVEDTAARLREVTRSLGEMSRVLHGTADGDWRGKTAEAFRAKLAEDLRPKVDDAHRSYELASRSMSGWVSTLESLQRRAQALERDAADAAQRARTAAAGLAAMPPAPGFFDAGPADPAEAARLAREADARDSAQRAVDAAEAEVEETRRRARALSEEFRSAGEAVGRGLRDASGFAPDAPGWLDSIADAIGDFASSIGEMLESFGDVVIEFLAEHADFIADVASALSMLATVLGVLSMIPCFAFLAPFALVVGGFALVAKYASNVGASGSFVEALKDPSLMADAAMLVVGIGAFKLGNQLTNTIRATNPQNARLVHQGLTWKGEPVKLLGKGLTFGQETVPYGFMGMVNGKVTQMGTAEAAYRSVRLHATWADWVKGSTEVPGGAQDITRWFHSGFGSPRPDRKEVPA